MLPSLPLQNAASYFQLPIKFAISILLNPAHIPNKHQGLFFFFLYSGSKNPCAQLLHISL